MKIEVEVSEEELRAAIQGKIREGVAVLLNSYTTDIYIQEQIKRNWRQAVDALVLEALSDHKELRARISAKFERKLRLQLAAQLKPESESKFCGSCQWFRGSSYSVEGECEWGRTHPLPFTLSILNQRVMPNWGRHCTEWELKSVPTDGN